MNLLKAFESIESLVFEIASWIFFVPKTLLQATFSPRWIGPYVATEAKKKGEERHHEYMPPILFWLVAGVLPYAVLVQWASTGTPASAIIDSLVPIAVTLGLAPLLLTTALAVVRKGATDRTLLRQLFEAECLSFTPLMLSGVPLTASNLAGVKSGTPLEFAAFTPLVVGMIALVFSQGPIFEEHLKISGERSHNIASIVTTLIFLTLIVAILKLPNIVASVGH